MTRNRPSRFALLLAGSAAAALAVERPADGGGPAPGRGDDRPSAAFYARVEARIEANLAELGALGLDLPLTGEATSFAWPLAPRNLGNFGFHATVNFVDQDPTAGIGDFNCGSRTYDGHRGTDLGTWPFGWLLMDESRVEVRAAAAGTIVDKDDGNFDRRCSCISNDPNFVILQHADGTRSWYLHLKSGSVTTKGVGASVAAGEVLGIVGSSGCSFGPHLHFEVRGAGAGDGDVLEPYDGVCNVLNASSLWIDQPPYRDPAVNRVATNSAPPVFPTCPTQETPNEKRLFEAGDPLVLVVYLRDEDPTRTKQLRLVRPDGAIHEAFQHTTGALFDKSYWFFAREAVEPSGRWIFRVIFDGETYDRAFWVGAIFADDFEDAQLEAWSDVSP